MLKSTRNRYVEEGSIALVAFLFDRAAVLGLSVLWTGWVVGGRVDDHGALLGSVLRRDDSVSLAMLHRGFSHAWRDVERTADGDRAAVDGLVA